MIEFENFKNQWKPQLYAIQAVTSGDALSLMQHLLRRVHGTIVSYQPISVSKSVLSSLMGKHRNSIKKYFEELEDLNLVSEHPSIDGSYPVFFINWEEIAAINDVCKKLNYAGQAELRNMIRGEKIIPFSKLERGDIDELLKKYSFNDNDYQDWKDAQNFSIPQNDNDAEIFSELCDLSGKAIQMLEESCTNFQHTCTKKQQGCTNFQHVCLNFQHTVQNFSNIYDLLQRVSVQISDSPKEIQENAKILEETCTNFQHLCTKFQHVFQKDAQNFSTVIKNNIENKIESRREAPYKGENKEKVEVEEELEGNDELPVDLNNSYDSFLENSLGESSSTNQETSSDENNLDQEQSEETFQEEEIKVQEIPDCEKFRDSSFPVYSQVEIERILDEHFQPESEIELAIREIWNELTQVEEDEDPVEVIPVNQFGRNLQNYIEDKTAADPEYPVTLQDLFNTFAFEYFLDDGMWLYKVSSSSIRNIQGKAKETQEEISSEEHEAEKNSRRRNDSVSRDCYFEAIQEVGDEDSEKLSDMEYVVYQLFSAINGPELTSIFPGSRMVDGRAICIKDIFWDKIDEWSEEANLERKDVDWMFKKFKQENKMLIIQPTKIKYQKILEWNHRYHAVKNSAELLWQQKMAELQN